MFVLILDNSWQKDVVGMVEEKHPKYKTSIHFECETLKADEAAEDHLRKFMPKLIGMDAVGNISLCSFYLIIQNI